jgi:UDP-N-acetylglucosamine 2-epimerase (non-hydrolysing)
MKVKPVLDALERRDVSTVLVHTGQHYAPSMSDVFFEELGLRTPDHYLGIGSGSHAYQTGRIMEAFETLVEAVHPDAVVVVGDVNSTLACALAAAKMQPLVGHVEAGLRSGDWTMPEEVNRVVTDAVSDLLFAPSEEAAANLRAEGREPIHVVGNVMVDSLLVNLARAKERPTLARFGLTERQFGLVTLHRPASVDNSAVLKGLLRAFGEIAEALPLVLPAHPRTSARLEGLRVPRGIQVVEPLGYLDFLALEAAARLVITDSGGVQEETTVLGIPCLTLRDTTERPVTVTHGTNRVVGRAPATVVREAHRAMEEPVSPRRVPLWDGCAGERIAEVLVDTVRGIEPAPTCAATLRPR